MRPDSDLAFRAEAPEDGLWIDGQTSIGIAFADPGGIPQISIATYAFGGSALDRTRVAAATAEAKQLLEIYRLAEREEWFMSPNGAHTLAPALAKPNDTPRIFRQGPPRAGARESSRGPRRRRRCHSIAGEGAAVGGRRMAR